MLALEGMMNADQIVGYIMYHDEKTALLGQIERMNRRIDEAVERWHSDRRALQSEIEEWRGKLLAAETVRTRHASTIMRLRQCLELLDQKGGLGLEVHERIKQTLDEVPR